MEPHRQHWIKIYTGLFSALGILILPAAVLYTPEDHTGLIIFCALAAAAEMLSVELFITTRRSRISISAIISIAVIMLYGAWSAALIGAVIGLTSIITTSKKSRRKRNDERASWLRRGLFNLGMMTVSNLAAGYIYTKAGGSVGQPVSISNLLPLVSAVLANETLNIVILLGVLHIQTSKSLFFLWKQNFAWVAPLAIVTGVIGGWALAIAYFQNHILGLMVFVLPIAATSYSISLYVDHTKKYVGKLEALNKSLDDANTGLLETLGAVIDAYDVFTYGHSAQVAVYVEAIVDQLQLPADQKAVIVKAALVHDIGKVGITDKIIGKQGPLSEEEYYLVQRHPIIGADILRRTNGLKDLVPLVRHHHEHWDGSGYPAGLAGNEIPLGARLIAVADAVDAMVSARPYRTMQTIPDVRAELMRCSGSQFDPTAVEALLSVMDQKGSAFFTDSGLSVFQDAAEVVPEIFDPRLRYLKRSLIIE